MDFCYEVKNMVFLSVYLTRLIDDFLNTYMKNNFTTLKLI